jgi:hypothetical protein
MRIRVRNCLRSFVVLAAIMANQAPAIVFVLQHAHPKNDGDEDVKLNGAYSRQQAAEQASTRESCLAGGRYELDSNST